MPPVELTGSKELLLALLDQHADFTRPGDTPRVATKPRRARARRRRGCVDPRSILRSRCYGVAIFSILWDAWFMAEPAPALDTEPVVARPEEARLLEVLRGALEAPDARASAARLLATGGQPVEVPGSVYEVLVRVVRELAAGNAVAVLPVHAELTTQQTADLLNVSRPYLIALLDEGALPCTRTEGGHRRLRLTDVLAYKRARDAERRAALDEMSAEAEQLGLRY